MDKKLKAQIAYIEKHAKHPTPELVEYHKLMLQHFQHERFIHLIVTMFFALFMIIFFIIFMCFAVFLPASDANSLVTTGFGLIDVILLITTLFYVRHYYRLENGVERLEELSKEMCEPKEHKEKKN